MAFWKRKKEEELPAEETFEAENKFEDLSMPEVRRPSLESPFAEQPTGDMKKDLELLNAKLDAIKALLESLNQRVEHIERIAEGE
ncbi:hypothetical protein HYV79_03120 [Candidatus Woesearchaeota archaeon]|nr:hypothetical protein [Candidatus Woesearchaeota archaeon]